MTGGNTSPSVSCFIDGTLGTATFGNGFPVLDKEHARQCTIDSIMLCEIKSNNNVVWRFMRLTAISCSILMQCHHYIYTNSKS